MTKPAPYSADTRAKGWRFELDLERIRQSDTWAVAPADVRPWLLMLWATAWEQTPCGSMPDDDELIAAHIGMKPSAFQKARRVLLRGWWKADDGRLYHDTITARVLEMLAAKDKDRRRKADYRARKSAAGQTQDGRDRPEMSRGTDAGQTWDGNGTDTGRAGDSIVGDDTGTGTGTSIKQNSSAAASHAGARAHEGDDPPPPDDDPPSEPDDPPRPPLPPAADSPAGERAREIAVLLRRWERARGKQPKGTNGHDPKVASWVLLGLTDQELAEAYALAVADRDKNRDPASINTGFLDVFVQKLRRPQPARASPGGKPSAAQQRADWSRRLTESLNAATAQPRHEIDMGVIDATGQA